MFIETALKNIALNTIMTEIDSSSVYDMYDKAISSYKNAPAGTREDIKIIRNYLVGLKMMI